MALQKCFFRHFFSSPSFRFPFLFVGSLCCCFGVLLSFNLNSNRLMPMATDNGFSSAFTNDPVPLMAMPHSPTEAEEFPYDFWKENKPFAHIHGDEPNRQTMRHQHFALPPYFDDTFGNFITDPPGMGLNSVVRSETTKSDEEKGVIESNEREAAEEKETGPNVFVGDETFNEQKGDANGWEKNGGGLTFSFPEGQFNIFDRTKGIGKIPSYGKGIGHAIGQSFAISPPPLPLATSSWPIPSASRQTMKQFLRFYHRPKISSKDSKSNLSPPTLIVPASSSFSAANDPSGTKQRQMTRHGTVIDADIPFIEPTDLRDAQPIETEKKKGRGQANADDRLTISESAERGHQQQKLVLKTDSVFSTTVPKLAVIDSFEIGTRTKTATVGPMPCGQCPQKSQNSAALCDCDKSSTGFYCPSPKKCCCCGADQQNECPCSNCSVAEGRCCENANENDRRQQPNVWLTIRCCCCRRRSIRTERKSKWPSGRHFSQPFNHNRIEN
ncbi:hypothetical protein niasHT_007188 [Heterodera trifolii]|uniref:Uncharacterized protein n=1 Tax=Heterodera trifolii TaxID=157864 RepID=A0ABD2LL80_9BILA